MTRAGVTVTLTVNSRSLAAGSQTTATADIRNDTKAEVLFDGDECTAFFRFTLTGPQFPAESAGRTWTDPRLAYVKFTATYNPVSLFGFRNAVATDIRIPVTCAVAFGRAGLRPGRTLHLDALLAARRTDGLPAPPGRYTAGYTFATASPMHVEVPIDVIGEPYAGISRAEAIDAALANRTVAAWLYELGTSGIEDGAAWYDDGAWTITIRTWSGGSGSVSVDSAGHVSAILIPTQGR